MRMLTQENKTIVSAATIVAAFSLLSRVAGFIRDRILAGTFGAGDVLDAYYTAFLVPDFLFNLLVVGAISASFVPLFSKYLGRNLNMERAWHLTNSVLNMLGCFFLLVAVILFVLAEPIAEQIAPGFGSAKVALTAQMMRVMFGGSFLLALSVVFGSVLQAMKQFFLFSLSPILYNIGIILGALFLVPMLGAIGLAWGVVLGASLHLLAQLLGVLARGYRYQWVWTPRDLDTQEVGKLMLPRTIGAGVNMLNTFVLTVIATTLTAGSVTIYQFAYNIQFFPIGIIAVSFAVASFPSLVEYANDNNTKGFVDAFSHTIRQIFFFIIPASILFLLLRAQIVRVVVGAGAFGWEETIRTADTLAFFTLSLFAQGLIFLFARAFYAHKDTVTPLVAGLVSMLINIVAALLFSREFGVIGLAIAFSLGSIVNLALLWAMLRQKLGSLNELEIVQSLFRICTAAAVCAVVVQIVKSIVVQFITLDTFFAVLSQGLIAGGAGLLAYGLGVWLLKSPEMIGFLGSMRRQFFRSFKPSEPTIAKDQNVI